jgi:hypothetical protein
MTQTLASRIHNGLHEERADTQPWFDRPVIVNEKKLIQDVANDVMLYRRKNSCNASNSDVEFQITTKLLKALPHANGEVMSNYHRVAQRPLVGFAGRSLIFSKRRVKRFVASLCARCGWRLRLYVREPTAGWVDPSPHCSPARDGSGEFRWRIPIILPTYSQSFMDRHR